MFWLDVPKISCPFLMIASRGAWVRNYRCGAPFVSRREAQQSLETLLSHDSLLLSFKMILTLCGAFLLCPSWIFQSQTTPKPPLVVTPINPSWQVIEKLISSGQLREARERLNEEIATQGETYKSLYLEALILFKENRFNESLRKLERSLALEKRDPEPHKLTGLILVVLERADTARPFLEAAVQLAPGDSMAHYYLGRLYYTIQRFPQAASEFRRVIALDPTYVKGYDNLGLALEALGDEEVAIQTYHKAIELNEEQKLKNEWPYLNLGKFLVTKNRYQESLSLLQKAVELNPGSAEAYYVLGKVLAKLGKDAEALEALKQSTLDDPKYGEAHYLLSRIYLRRGQEDEAQKEIKIFQELKKSGKKNDVLAR